MDIDLSAPRFERIVGSDPPLDQIAHGTYFGEGPVWDPSDEVLWWVDIEECKLHRYDPAVHTNKAVDVGQRVGAVVPRRQGGLMLALENGFAERHTDHEARNMPENACISRLARHDKLRDCHRVTSRQGRS